MRTTLSPNSIGHDQHPFILSACRGNRNDETKSNVDQSSQPPDPVAGLGRGPRLIAVPHVGSHKQPQQRRSADGRREHLAPTIRGAAPSPLPKKRLHDTDTRAPVVPPAVQYVLRRTGSSRTHPPQRRSRLPGVPLRGLTPPDRPAPSELGPQNYCRRPSSCPRPERLPLA